jgi:lipoprotein-anchoring transpeptidase ErfK/SrfK
MHRLGTTSRARTTPSALTSRRGRARRHTIVAGIAAIGTAALTALTACTSASPPPGADPTSFSHAPGKVLPSTPSTSVSGGDATTDMQPAKVKVSPPLGSKRVNPVRPVTVTVANGTLTSVRMLNSQGRKVTGAMAAGGASWHSTEVLGYSKQYRLIAKVRNSDGSTTTRRTHFATLTPNNMTLPYFDDIYGSGLQRGATYGVGMVAVVNFDEAIPNRKAAEKVMQVTTTPHVDGAWYWTDDHTAHWRPRHYYAPGTKVQITVKDYGHNFGGGLYGQSDESTWFRIGAKHFSVANAKTHHVKVYFSNQLVRTMPTSMGQGGVVQGENGPIYLWTMPGIYTVINHENPAVMSSDSYGLPSTSAYGYPPEKVYWSTKISTDGIYLHELDTTVWAQGHENVSHGCLNLNETNAKWFYQHSRVGDVVKVVHSGGPKIQVWQGGDWSVPWKTWSQGGDL